MRAPRRSRARPTDLHGQAHRGLLADRMDARDADGAQGGGAMMEAQKRFADGRWKTDVTAIVPLEEAMERVPANWRSRTERYSSRHRARARTGREVPPGPDQGDGRDAAGNRAKWRRSVLDVLQLLVSGLANGCVYGLIAHGLRADLQGHRRREFRPGRLHDARRLHLRSAHQSAIHGAALLGLGADRHRRMGMFGYRST
jgi:hypothetical protein